MSSSLNGNEFGLRKEFLYACCIFVGYGVIHGTLKRMSGVSQLRQLRYLTQISKILRSDAPSFSNESCRPRIGPSLKEEAMAAL